jgi:hypothetical protein
VVLDEPVVYDSEHVLSDDDEPVGVKDDAL